MKKIIFAMILILMFYVNASAFAAGNLEKVEFSKNSVTVDKNLNAFSADIILTNNGPFSTVEIGLKLEGNVKIKSIDYNKTITGTKISVMEKNGINYFGFFDSSNKYNGKLNVCTVNFEYTGDAPAKVILAETHVTTISGTNATKETKTPGLEMNVTRSTLGSSGSGSHNSGSNSGEQVKTDLQINGNIIAAPSVEQGKASVKVDSESIDMAFEQAVSDSKGIKTIIIDMKQAKADEYRAEIPANKLSSGEMNKQIQIETPIATVLFSTNMIPQGQGGMAQTIGFNISKGDTSLLPEDVKQRIGGRPVIELYIDLDGNHTDWENESSAVTVLIPYTPTLQEQENTDNILLYYIDEKGATHVVPSGRYDVKSGNVVFKITHFSQYAVSYGEKSFGDIDGSWAKKVIEALTVRGIINGTSENTFAPGSNVTRADSLLLLVKAMGMEAKSGYEGNFADIQPTDYYYEALAIAKNQGITTGIGNNRFDPKAKITREDMMVMVANILEKEGKIQVTESIEELKGFVDGDKTSDYAKKSLAVMIRAGIINGDAKGMLNPKGTATRAETAAIIYNCMYKL